MMMIIIVMDNNWKGRVNVDMIVTYLVKQGQGRIYKQRKLSLSLEVQKI